MMAKEHNVTKAKRRAAPSDADQANFTAPTWALETWKDLNDYLRTCDERGANALLEVERKRESPRKQYVMRIHSRINRLRRRRERAELRSAP